MFTQSHHQEYFRGQELLKKKKKTRGYNAQRNRGVQSHDSNVFRANLK